MITLSFINQKGGVGKTTLSMNTAVQLGMARAKVLFVDMDPQCNLTYIMRADKAPYNLYDVLTGAVPPERAIFRAPEGDILAGSANLSLLERKFSGKDRGLVLRKALQQLQGYYQFVVIDSPPALGLLMMNALAAADSVVIPAYADVFSLQGIGQLATTIRAVQTHTNPGLHIDGILVTYEDGASTLSRDVKAMLEEVAKKLGTEIFETNIRRAATVQEAQAKRQSIYKYAPESGQAADYRYFTLEYLQRLRKRLNR